MFGLIGIPVWGAEPVVHDGTEFFYFLRGLFFPTHVASLSDPSVERGAHFGESLQMLRASGIDEVVEFVGIGLGVVEVFAAELGEERAQVWIEFALFVQVTHDLLHGETFLLIKIHVGAEVDLGLEVADVMVTLTAHRSQAELHIIHANVVAKDKDDRII